MTKSRGIRDSWRPTECKTDGCDEISEAKGYCIKHYHRVRRHGDPHAGRPSRDAVTAEMLRISKSEDHECVRWPFSYEPTGYGKYNGAKAHREICRMAHGEPPTPAHEAAHSCGNGHLGCVNPKHLRWATHAENMADMVAHGTSSGKPRLDKSIARKLRQMRADGAKIVDISRTLGLPYPTVHRAISGVTWGDNTRNKLTAASAAEIRALRGKMPAREIASRYNIAVTYVYEICNFKVWKSVA